MNRTIPHLDLADFIAGDAAARAAFARATRSALERYGFFTLSGHRVAAGVLQDAYDRSHAFFARPDAEKMRYAGALRGYTPFGVEVAKGESRPDLKEFWQIGHGQSADDLDESARNVWPDEPQGFRATFETLFDQLYRTGCDVLSAIAISLDLPPDYFDDRVRDGTSLLRLLHYPPLTGEMDTRAVRAAAHEDINLITLLVAAEGAGLELLDRDGSWLPVVAEPGDLIVDSGDMMARITNGVIPATTHRVVNPAGPNVSRYSMPFFLQPRNEVMLDCIPACRDGSERAAMTAGEYLNERLAEIGLPPSGRDETG